MKKLLILLLLPVLPLSAADNVIFSGGNIVQAENQSAIARIAAVESSPGSGIYSLNLGGTVTTTASTVTAYTPFAITSVTTSSTAVLAANAARLSAVICNNGAVDIYLRLGTPAVANQGILLKANGGSYTIGSTNLYKGIITAVTASGAGVLCGTEGI